MTLDKNSDEKTRLHPRNKNRERYDLSALIKVSAELKNHIALNKYSEVLMTAQLTIINLFLLLMRFNIVEKYTLKTALIETINEIKS